MPKPVLHVIPQAPLVQVAVALAPVLHTTPQPPQLLVSVCSLTHTLAHMTRGEEQTFTQEPLVQTCPV